MPLLPRWSSTPRATPRVLVGVLAAAVLVVLLYSQRPSVDHGQLDMQLDTDAVDFPPVPVPTALTLRPGQVLARVPVVGEVDGTGLRQFDLGEKAEARYHIVGSAERGEDKLFFGRLKDFIDESIPPSLKRVMHEALSHHLPPKLHPRKRPSSPQAPLVSFRHIFQTAREDNSEWTQMWAEMNKPEGWILDFYDDARSEQWVSQTFAEPEEGRHIRWAYNAMQRGVLKADFLRYLLPLVKGGVYTDIDTIPKRPINEWGTIEPQYYDISATDGYSWPQQVEDLPSVIVGVDIDVHEREDWDNPVDSWEQPLGICQWALASVPHHPIMLEIVRRVVNNTRHVDDSGEPLKVLHWTGPPAFTDSVLSYLLARYNVPWQHLRGIRRPLRIGEVMVLPITAFSPGGEKDFGAEPSESEQCALVHTFKGSWKSDGA